MNLYSELKRRGVLQVGMAYLVVSWLLVQVASVLLPAFEVPAWAMRATILLLALGFPIALAISWIFDLTSSGLVRTEDADGEVSARAFPHETLNYVIIGLLAAAVILFTLDKFYWQTDLGLDALNEVPSIAVLPFENISGQKENEPFTVGIHDDLLTQLSKISALRVLSRTSVLRYRDTEKPIPEIAKELGVGTILEGGVQRSADRVRINVQLIDGTSDAHLWAETFDRQLTAANIFAIQSDISRSIARAMQATLTSDEKQVLAQVPTENLAAYDAYVSAAARLDSLATEEIEQAVTGFTLATQLDAEFSAAWAGLCKAHLALYKQNSDRLNFDAAEAACERALELDDSRVEVHIALGTLYRFFGQYSRAEVSLQRANYARAEQALENALSIDSLTVEALIELGIVLAWQNRRDEAETELLRAAQLDPGSWSAQNALFSFYYSFSDRADRFEYAARYAAQAASLRPDMAASWNNLGTANFMLARYEQAADAWQQSLALEPTRTAYTNTGIALYNSGQFEEAAQMQEKAIELAPNDHRAWGRLADALRFVEGEGERVLANYTRALELAREQLIVNGQDWRTLALLSFYLAHMGENEEAMTIAQRALQLSQRNAETLFYIALVNLENGQTDTCLLLLEEAVARDDSFRQLIEIDPDLKQLSKLERFQAIIGTAL